MAKLTGTESGWRDERYQTIKTALEAATGRKVLKSKYLLAFCEGISNSDVPHLVNNVQVDPGQGVSGETGPTAAQGDPTPLDPDAAKTSTPGTIS